MNEILAKVPISWHGGLLKAALEHSPDLVYIKDASGRIIAISAAGAALFRRTSAEIEGGDDFSSCPVAAERWRRLDRGVLEGGESVSGDEEIEVAGEKIFLRITRVAICDQQGGIAGVLVTGRDVTERKRLEARFREGEMRYRCLVQAAAEIVWTAHGSGPTLDSSPEWRAFTGQTAEEAAGAGWLDAVHPDDRSQLLCDWKRASETGRAFEAERRVRRADGEWRHMHVRAVPRVDESGAIAEWVGTHTDVTEKRRAAERLRQSEERFRKLFHSDLLGIGIPDRDGQIVDANDEFLRIVGYTREELRAGQVRWDAMTPPEYMQVCREHMQEALERGSCTPYEKEYLRKDGSRIPIQCAYAVLDAAEGTFIGYILDLSGQKRAEEALRQADKLAFAGRLAACLAHEINNPLSAATNSMFLAMLCPEAPEGMLDWLRLADQELRRVGQVVAQSLRFHRQATTPVAANPGELMDSVLPLFASRMSVCDVALQREYRPHEKIYCYDNELRHAFANVISNALDAVPRSGTIRVRIRQIRGGVRITVADNGRGMRPEVSARLFEPFVTTKEGTGTGLGLWATKGIVRKHGGRIAIRTAHEGDRHGTTVSLFFPSDGLQGGGEAGLQSELPEMALKA